MKKNLLILIISILCFKSYSQISFEKGYIINDSNQKTECLIKNSDWILNPSYIEYKLSEGSEPITADVKTIKEFNIYNGSKFVRKTVKVDMSKESISNLSANKYPEFVEQTLFLKVLIEGISNLYQYESSSMSRFFYNKNNSEQVEQLVFKSYYLVDNTVATNNQFKQQLWMDLKCKTIEMNTIEKLQYTKSSLINFFKKYYECTNGDFVNSEAKKEQGAKRDLFNVTIRPRINNSSVSVQSLLVNSSRVDYNNKINFGVGVEAEFLFPFNKNKWAFAIEPTYQSVNSAKETYFKYVGGRKLVVTLDYSSLEIPLTLRHYMFFNKDSKLFINASYVLDFSFNSSILMKGTVDDFVYEDLELVPSSNIAIGLGYKFKDKYSIEMRYQFNRELLGINEVWGARYNALSLIVGYTIF
jgi:hypothetical protein